MAATSLLRIMTDAMVLVSVFLLRTVCSYCAATSTFLTATGIQQTPHNGSFRIHRHKGLHSSHQLTSDSIPRGQSAIDYDSTCWTAENLPRPQPRFQPESVAGVLATSHYIDTLRAIPPHNIIASFPRSLGERQDQAGAVNCNQPVTGWLQLTAPV
jgi:hypothetical protein